SKLHPSGSLGKRLLLRVRDVMHRDVGIPRVPPRTRIVDAIVTMTAKQMGAVLIVDEADQLLGIFTDGDLRRTVMKDPHLLAKDIDAVMIPHPIIIHPDEMAVKALEVMENRPSQISVLPVVDAERRVVGIVRVHDLVQAGL